MKQVDVNELQRETLRKILKHMMYEADNWTDDKATAASRFECFGRLVWDTLKKHYSAAEMTEGDEEYMELALRCGLCTREPYDQEKHGFVNDAEPGDMIYVWGER